MIIKEHIEQRFIKCIKNNEANILIGKLDTLRQTIINDFFSFEYPRTKINYNGRFIEPFDEINIETDETEAGAYITFKGYEIIKKSDFEKWFEYYPGMNNNFDYVVKNNSPKWVKDNQNLIFECYQWLMFDYLKYEEEFIVYFIESWE